MCPTLEICAFCLLISAQDFVYQAVFVRVCVVPLQSFPSVLEIAAVQLFASPRYVGQLSWITLLRATQRETLFHLSTAGWMWWISEVLFPFVHFCLSASVCQDDLLKVAKIVFNQPMWCWSMNRNQGLWCKAAGLSSVWKLRQETIVPFVTSHRADSWSCFIFSHTLFLELNLLKANFTKVYALIWIMRSPICVEKGRSSRLWWCWWTTHAHILKDLTAPTPPQLLRICRVPNSRQMPTITSSPLRRPAVISASSSSVSPSATTQTSPLLHVRPSSLPQSWGFFSSFPPFFCLFSIYQCYQQINDMFYAH